jgi:hypothetical protein
MNTNKLKLLLSMIDKKNKYDELSGVFFDAKNNAVVATDTRRMIVFDADHSCNGIVHHTMVNTIAKMGTERKPIDVDISQTSEGMITFKLDTKNGELEFGAKPLGCRYVDYRSILPSSEEMEGKYEKFETVGERVHIDIIMHGVPVEPSQFKEIVKHYFYDKMTVYYIDKVTPPVVVHSDFKFIVQPIFLGE